MNPCNKDDLYRKLQILNKNLWEYKADKVKIDIWLKNFKKSEAEELHALYLLSQFMFFGNAQIRELLKALYRDTFKYPLISKIRKKLKNTKNAIEINQRFEIELEKTRFLPIGNPSESGSHILYYFRQENNLSKDLFINSNEILYYNKYSKKNVIRNKKIKRYIFVDDFCGSGHQVSQDFTAELVNQLLEINPKIEVYYYSLFATSSGLKYINKNTKFIPKCSFELDNTFQCFSDKSRYFYIKYSNIDKGFAEKLCRYYGSLVDSFNPLGYNNGELLIGFFHNVPDNTLPIFWGENDKITPIFKRYIKNL